MSFVKYDGIDQDLACLQNLQAQAHAVQFMHGPGATPNVSDSDKQSIQRLINSMVSAGHYIPKRMIPLMNREGFIIPPGAVVQ